MSRIRTGETKHDEDHFEDEPDIKLPGNRNGQNESTEYDSDEDAKAREERNNPQSRHNKRLRELRDAAYMTVRSASTKLKDEKSTDSKAETKSNDEKKGTNAEDNLKDSDFVEFDVAVGYAESVEEFDGPGEQQGAWSNSKDIRVVLWSLVKITAFFIAMAISLAMWRIDFKRRSCTQVPTQSNLDICVYQNSTFDCVGFNGLDCTSACQNRFGSTIVGEGCIIFSQTSIQCFNTNEFIALCRDSLSCTAADERGTKTGFAFIGFWFLLMFIMEMTYTWRIATLSSMHYNEIQDMAREKWPGRFLCCTKIYPTTSLFSMFILFLLILYIVFTVFTQAKNCENTLTIDGLVNDFYPYSKHFVIGVSVGFVFIMSFGSFVRKHCPVRAEMYRPSFKEERNCKKRDLLCGSCRDKKAPRWSVMVGSENIPPRCCSGCFTFFVPFDTPSSQLRRKQRACRGCCRALGVIWDCLFTPCLMLGECCESVVADRHFIGP